MCHLMLLVASLSGWAAEADDLASETLRFLGAVQLTDSQSSAVDRLRTEYSRKFEALERQAASTREQTQQRQQALARAVMNGHRGQQVRSYLRSAGQPTASQQSAAAELVRLRAELERKVQALLTDDQRARLSEERLDAGPDADQYSGFLIVRLSPSLPAVPDHVTTLEGAARILNIADLQAVVKEYQLLETRRSLRTMPVGPPVPASRQAAKDALIQRLRSYWRIDVRGRDADDVESLLMRLNGLNSVDVAYREREVDDPSFAFATNPADDPYAFRQEYLTAAPKGIDAVFAWTQSCGEGNGVGLVDVEKSWNPNHHDLAGKAPLLIHGDIKHGSDHGTAALGETVADDNRIGVIGIAPCPAYVFLSSWYHADGSGPDVPEAICSGLNVMDTGDVLQLEVQCKPGIPIEDDDVVYDMIRLATLCDVIVVEAAGNRGRDLDAHTNLGLKIFNRSTPDFRDSGAILVGGSKPRDGHVRASWSCFGSRVDCFAWGEFVTSTGFFGAPDLDDGGGDPNKTYTRKYNGTSSAVPIISGAAMLLQGMAKGNTGRPIGSADMRKLLSDPGNGTLQGTGVAGAIGVMPDLKVIIENNRPVVGSYQMTSGSQSAGVPTRFTWQGARIKPRRLRRWR